MWRVPMLMGLKHRARWTSTRFTHSCASCGCSVNLQQFAGRRPKPDIFTVLTAWHSTSTHQVSRPAWVSGKNRRIPKTSSILPPPKNSITRRSSFQTQLALVSAPNAEFGTDKSSALSMTSTSPGPHDVQVIFNWYHVNSECSMNLVQPLSAIWLNLQYI